MPIRPGDSTPKFDNIPEPLEEGPVLGPPGFGIVREEAADGESPSIFDEQDASASRPGGLPSTSGSPWEEAKTEVYTRDRLQAEAADGELTEPMFPRFDPSQHPATAAAEAPTLELPPPAPPPTPTPGPSAPSAGTAGGEATPAGGVTPAAPPRSTSPPPSPAPPSPARVVQQTGVPAAPQRSLAVVLLFSYASAVTIALIYLLLTRGGSGPQRHQLEDLRDPADEEGTVRIIQRGVDLPLGHTLRLRESRRFGNILVEPLRVTRGPIEFQHFSGNPRKTHPPTPPVLKLWLRLTNVSTDQEIAPLDGLLLYKRALNREGRVVANAFVCRAEDVRDGEVIFTYPASPNSEWDMRGQHLGRVLKPGESLETFIPSDAEGLDRLQGELVWRFQLRKGYAPTGRGVTTLIQVTFPAAGIESEPTRQAGAESTHRWKGMGGPSLRRLRPEWSLCQEWTCGSEGVGGRFPA